MSPEERRKYPRIPFENELKYRVITATSAGTQMYETAKSRDLSEGGVGFVAEDQLNCSDLLKVEMHLEDRLLRAYAEVAWVGKGEENDQAGECLCGLRFLGILNQDSELISEKVKSFRKQAAPEAKEKKPPLPRENSPLLEHIRRQKEAARKVMDMHFHPEETE